MVIYIFCLLDLPVVTVVNNVVGIAVGVSVAGFVLFVVIPIIICVVIGFCVARSVGAAGTSSKQPHTAVDTSQASAASTANGVTTSTQQTAYPLTTDAQSYPTDVKQAPPSAQPVEVEMQDQKKDYPHQPQEVYPQPSLQSGYPPQ